MSSPSSSRASSARLFDTRNSQNDIRSFLNLPPKGWDSAVDKKWARSMDDITSAYLGAEFDSQASWRFVPASSKQAVTQRLLDPWRSSLPEWDAAKLEQVILWRLQILHKRERDRWWQERRKRRNSKADSACSSPSSPIDTTVSPPSSDTSSAASSARDSCSPPRSPLRGHADVASYRPAQPSISSLPYDPVREAAGFR